MTDQTSIAQLAQRLPSLDVENGLELAGQDASLYLTTLRAFLLDIPLVAQTLQEKLDGKDFTGFAQSAHTARTGLNGIGFPSLAIQALLLEKAGEAEDDAYAASHLKAFLNQLAQLEQELKTALFPAAAPAPGALPAKREDPA